MKMSIAAVTAALLLTIAPAHTRAATPSPSQLTLKAGAGFVGNTKPAVVFAAGADYAIAPATKLTPVTVSLYADLFGKSGGGGVAVRNAGATYLGAGLGYYSVTLNPIQGGPAGIFGPPPQTTFTSSGVGGKIFAGFGASGLSFEVGYHFLPSAGGYQTGAATAQLAVHL